MLQRQSKRHKRPFFWLRGVCISIVMIGVVYLLTYFSLRQQGYYPLESVLDKLSFEKVDNHTFSQEKNDLRIRLDFDFQSEEVAKNGYTFSLSNQVKHQLGKHYLSDELIRELFMVEPENNWLDFSLKERSFTTHQWTEAFPALIAHAGGTYREKSGNTFYTNSLEALQQNYSLGHRVFEMDFSLTSDGKMAAVHDWEQFGHLNGLAMSSTEWKDFQTFGSPMTDARFTSLLIGDVLDQMMVNKDLFLVTDTKSFGVSEEDIRHQFTEIYNEAIKRDPSLLHRIIPQIYNQRMYAILSDIYDFPSLIYTLYASPDSPEQVLEFVSNYPEIKVVTIPLNHGGYFTQDFFNALHQLDKKVYTHTIHTYDELTKYRALGVDGFYTGLLLPVDMERLESLP